MKKKFLFALMLTAIGVLVFGAISVSAEIVNSGTCGENLTWTVDDKGKLVISGTGAMYNYSWYGEHSPWSGGGIETVTIEKGVTTIGDYAFYKCFAMTNVTIPEGVETIGCFAFSGCNTIKNIEIGNGTTQIGESAFSLTNITSVTIPGSVTTIGSKAFQFCGELEKVNITDLSAWCNIAFEDETSNPLYYAGDLYLNGNIVRHLIIPDGVTAIGDYVFNNCNGIESVTMPDSVTTIGDYTFEYCTGLTNVTIGKNVTTIGRHGFYYCTGLTSVIIPDAVTTINSEAFSHCLSLLSVTIGKGVTEINRGVFSSCQGLISITIPNNVTVIGDDAFDHCVMLASVTIPNSVIQIGNRAFHTCTGLTSVTIPDSVSSIGDYAFSNCTGLAFINISNSITIIGYNAFYKCSNLTDVYYNGMEDEWNNIEIRSCNEPLLNANIHYTKHAEYKINSITLKDASGNELDAIPKGNFLTTVSFTNVSSSTDTLIILAQYAEDGAFKGLMYIQTEDVPVGESVNLSIPVDNTSGEVAELKALCWESLGSARPLGTAVSFK